MPRTDEAKNIWLDKLRECYRGDLTALEKIADLSKEYTADDAILSYTKDVFKPVNHALRTEDIISWYFFRYYIVDICKQIEVVHQQQKYCENLILYRGQIMSRKELESIKELTSTNDLFITIAFFSTSKNISVAEHFIGDINGYDEPRVPVLFEITVDSVDVKTVIFVDINQHLLKKYNLRGGEDEFLFTIGSIFRITSVESDSKDSRL